MAFPVTLNSVTYTLADFEGLNYVDGFPNALEDFVTEAGAKVTAAQTAQSAAAGSQVAAAASETAAAASAASAAASFDSFDDRYLGAKSSAPTVDNDGDALLTGALYFNSTTNQMNAWSGSAWEAAYLPGSAYLELAGGTMSGFLTLSADPTSSLHAATKQYVDTIAAAGLHYHDPVRVEKEGNLNATYDNGSSGVGATLTNAGTQEALVIDGVSLALNDRVLVYEQTDATQNGVYTVTTVGDGSTNWVLTRATDADSYSPSDPDSFGQGDAFYVLDGTAGAGELYVMNTEGTITFGTTDITFAQISSAQVYSGGTGISISGSVISSDITFAEVTANGATTTDAVTVGSFTSTGIDDNASSTAITIDSSQNVGIGTASPGRNLTVSGTGARYISVVSTDANSAGILLGDNANDAVCQLAYVNSDNSLRIHTNGAEDMRLTSGGDLHVDGDVIAYSTTISDQRLKDDVEIIGSALDKVSNLRGVTYTWNAGSREGQRDMGVIAQEVEEVIPEIVYQKEMALIDGETYKTVDYEKLTAVLIEAVKELKAEVEALKGAK